MLNGTNAYASALARYLINGGVIFDVADMGTSGSVGVNNVRLLNYAIQQRLITATNVVAFFTITIDRTEFSNPDKVASLAANLIHEGTHVVIRAFVLASIGTKDPKDADLGDEEALASQKTAEYLKANGGSYAAYGKKIGLLDSRGNVSAEMMAMKNAAGRTEQAPLTTVREWLKDWGVKW
jgi:hypothetical protein